MEIVYVDKSKTDHPGEHETIARRRGDLNGDVIVEFPNGRIVTVPPRAVDERDVSLSERLLEVFQ